MAYIGREPQIGNYQVCDAISVVNAQAAYTMQVNSVNVIPESVNHMIVSLNGVIQKPGSSYTISSSTITFSSNLATGDSIDFIYLLGNVLDLGTPSDDTVTGAKIVDNAINSEHYTDASIDLAHLSADSVDGSKIADNAINSEHYTDGSIDTAHIADAQVTLAKLAADSVNATKIADDAISEEHLDVTSITGHTAETSIADGDTILIHDASASALRKMTKANFVSGIGGTNTPCFSATMSAGQGIANTTFVKINFDTEVFDVGGGYDTTNKRFVVPSGEAGKYVFEFLVSVDGLDDAEFLAAALYKNGTRDDKSVVHDYSPSTNDLLFVKTGKIYNLSVDDYIEAFVYHNEGAERSVENTRSHFFGYKLIE